MVLRPEATVLNSPGAATIYNQSSGHGLLERIGHRGANRELPENTLSAFRRAFERGADAIELDVHATRDGVVIVHHDPTVASVRSSLRGRAIADLDWSDLSQVELTPGLGIPTLHEVLRSAPVSGRVYVEIKAVGIEELVAAVLGTFQSRCAVHSFNHDAVKRMMDLAPTIPRGILFDRASRDVESAMRTTGARDVWPEWMLIDQALIDRVHDADGRVIAWTVNSRSTAEQLLGMGVDGLCTDDVRLFEGLTA